MASASDFDGKKLRNDIKKFYFTGDATFPANKKFIIGQAKGRAMHLVEYNSVANYEEEVRKKFRDIVQRRLRRTDVITKEWFKNLNNNINTPCDRKGILPREGWGTTQYNYLLYDFFYKYFQKIVLFYIYDERNNYFRTDLSARGREVRPLQKYPVMNLFFQLSGGHFNVLRRKEGTTDAQLNALQKGKNPPKAWKKYFNKVDVSIKGLCYWDAVSKAFELETRDKTSGSRKRKRQRVDVDLTMD
jgi:hypothetical protein